MEHYYQFAGVGIAVQDPQERKLSEGRWLDTFRSEPLLDAHHFTVDIVDTLDAPKGKLVATLPGGLVYMEKGVQQRYFGATGRSWTESSLMAVHKGKNHRIQLRASSFPDTVGGTHLLGALGAEHLVVRAGGVILHASYIVHEGQAILFTAPSETGKSTQAELWRQLRGAKIVNGDRAAIRMEDGAIMACGIPFAGSSQYCENVTAPLAAIVCLGQAPQTTIRPLRGYPAFRRIWEGCSINTWDQTDVEMAASLVQKILETVSVFQLDCTPDESAVIALEEKLREQVNQ